MQRRDVLKGMAAILASCITGDAVSAVARQNELETGGVNTSASDSSRQEPGPDGPPQQIAMLVYPQFTALDLVGPHTFLAGLMNAEVHLVWKNKEPIATDRGNLSILPSTSLSDCPKDLDLLFVPGGLEGTIAVMQDDEVLAFLRERAQRSRYVTSVCTGALILGAAGLLKGYRATTHWAFRDLLPLLGAVPVEQRVVEDRNRITGGGVTSGIDFGLTVTARMRGVRYAETLQLLNEYDPHPPFRSGNPKAAGLAITQELQELLAEGYASAKKAATNAGKRLA